MPYKNMEAKKKYQQEWYQRKKSGQPTRLTPINTKDKRKELEHIRNQRYYMKKRKIIEEKFGKECFFCKNGIVRIIHRKDGKQHEGFETMTILELRKLDDEEYVCVCGICHKGIHWAMKYLGLSWEDLVRKRT